MLGQGTKLSTQYGLRAVKFHDIKRFNRAQSFNFFNCQPSLDELRVDFCKVDGTYNLGPATGVDNFTAWFL